MHDGLVRKARGPSLHGTFLPLNTSWEADGFAFHGMAYGYFSQQQTLFHLWLNSGLGGKDDVYLAATASSIWLPSWPISAWNSSTWMANLPETVLHGHDWFPAGVRGKQCLKQMTPTMCSSLSGWRRNKILPLVVGGPRCWFLALHDRSPW